jgi:hypothetical protein
MIGQAEVIVGAKVENAVAGFGRFDVGRLWRGDDTFAFEEPGGFDGSERGFEMGAERGCHGREGKLKGRNSKLEETAERGETKGKL